MDAVVLTVRDGELVALVTATDEKPALPGGFVGREEAPLATVRRKLREKTGLRQTYLEQLGAFADPGRDPRGWIPSIAYLALVPPDTQATEADARWIPARGRTRLAFDHRTILRTAVERVEGKLWWSNIAVGNPARRVLDERRARRLRGDQRHGLRPRDLRPRPQGDGLVEATGEQRSGGPGRPAALYRFASHKQAWGAGHRKRVG